MIRGNVSCPHQPNFWLPQRARETIATAVNPTQTAPSSRPGQYICALKVNDNHLDLAVGGWATCNEDAYIPLEPLDISRRRANQVKLTSRHGSLNTQPKRLAGKAPLCWFGTHKNCFAGGLRNAERVVDTFSASGGRVSTYLASC
jgi:hypothetical protein